MRFYGDLTQAEIGERLGISQRHVSGCWRARSATCVTGSWGGTKPPTATLLYSPLDKKRRAGGEKWRHPGADLSPRPHR